MKRKSVKLSDDHRDQLEKIAADKGCTVDQVLSEILAHHFNRPILSSNIKRLVKDMHEVINDLSILNAINMM